MAQSMTYDREKVKAVRMKVLDEILEVLNETEKAKKFSPQKMQLLNTLAKSVMPRVNEISGPDGGDIPIPLFGLNGISNNNSNKED